MKPPQYKYDAFISHAVEDKIPIANEICRRLEEAGLRIWYSSEELGPGDLISKRIEDGLNESRFGVVIFTHTYLLKIYALREFFELLRMERDGRRRILPVLHEITPQELIARGLEMEDRFLISTSRGMDYVIDRLLRKIREPLPKPVRKPTLWKWLTGVITVMLASVGLYFGSESIGNELDNTIIESAIHTRIEDLKQKIDRQHELAMKTNSGKIVNQQLITDLYTEFQSFKSYYRNNYELDNGYRTIVAKKNVDAALGVDMQDLSPFNAYSFTDPVISLLVDRQESGERYVRYSLENTRPVTFNFDKAEVNEGMSRVTVTYQNNIRYIVVGLSLPRAPTEIKRHQMNIYALLPVETFEFHKENGAWVLSEIK